MIASPTHQAASVTGVEPPTAFLGRSAFRITEVIVLIIGGKHHTVVTECPRALQGISRIPGAAVHLQSILVGRLVANLERRVLHRVPETIRLCPGLDPQAVRLATCQKMESHETEPEMHITVTEVLQKSQLHRQYWSEDGFSQGRAKSQS